MINPKSRSLEWITEAARQIGVPVCLIAGRISDQEELLKAGFTHVECINPDYLSIEEAMRPEVAIQNISNTVGQFLYK